MAAHGRLSKDVKPRIYRAYIYCSVSQMNAVNSKTFKSGNSVAVRLPKALGLPENIHVTIERKGDAFIMRPVRDPAEEKRRVLRLIQRLEALPCPDEVELREPPMPPKRVDD